METIGLLILGLLSYWVTKFFIYKEDEKNPINNAGQFFSYNAKELIFSLIALIFVFVAKAYLQENHYIDLSNPISAFIAGGTLPSMINNFSLLVKNPK